MWTFQQLLSSLLHKWKEFSDTSNLWYQPRIEMSANLMRVGIREFSLPNFVNMSKCSLCFSPTAESINAKMHRSQEVCEEWLHSYDASYDGLLASLSESRVPSFLLASNPGFPFRILSLQSCETKSGTESLGSRLAFCSTTRDES